MDCARLWIIPVVGTLSGGVTTCVAHAASTSLFTPEVVVAYDPATLQAPEGIALDCDGNRYVSLALTGEVSRIDSNDTHEILAVLPLGPPLEPCHGFINVMGGIVFTPLGLFLNVNACNATQRGVWWVDPQNGDTALVANLPTDALANGIAHRSGRLYIADSAAGRIWRVSPWGGPAELWLEDSMLDPLPNDLGAPGLNGIQFFEDEVYVSNSSSGDIVAISVNGWTDEPGAIRIHATVSPGCDDFSFDLYGTLYCTTDPFNTLIAVHSDGQIEVILTADDGLDGPTATAFGRLSDAFDLYITNAAFPFFPNNGSPTLMRVKLGVPGYPVD